MAELAPSLDGALPITAAGGSGGGAGTGTSNQTDLSGDGGGNGAYSGGVSTWDGGGGGAGAGGSGSDGIDIGGQGGTGGAGGSGVQSSISTDPNQFYGSGGGGGGTSPSNVAPASQTNGFGGSGGNSGVGGNGGIVSSTKAQATSGANDTGSGGGGAGWVFNGTAADRKGGNGANGIIFLKFTLAQASISSLAVTSSSGIDQVYRSDETITVAVTFTQKVYITGNPRIQIQGLSSKYLVYNSGIDTTTITFSYRPVTGDLDLSGFEVSANSLELNGGTIKDNSGENVSLLHSAISALAINAIDARLDASATITIGASLSFRKPSNISATITQYGKVTFLIDGKRVAKCIKLQTNNSPGAYVATCNLIPAMRGYRTLRVDFYQNSSSSISASTSQRVFIAQRTGNR